MHTNMTSQVYNKRGIFLLQQMDDLYRNTTCEQVFFFLTTNHIFTCVGKPLCSTAANLKFSFHFNGRWTWVLSMVGKWEFKFGYNPKSTFLRLGPLNSIILSRHMYDCNVKVSGFKSGSLSRVLGRIRILDDMEGTCTIISASTLLDTGQQWYWEEMQCALLCMTPWFKPNQETWE